MNAPQQAIADAQAGAARAGYPSLWPVLLAIAGPESGFDPGAIGDGGLSFGYLQFFTGGGLGDGHSPAELLDGVSNMALGASYIGGRLAAGASLYDALQPWSTRAAALATLAAETGATGPIAGEPVAAGGVPAVAVVLVGVLAILILVR